MKTKEANEPQIKWDIGTAYDFFISMMVLLNPETFGLRGSWAAGVRSRLPANQRKFLEDTRDFTYASQLWVYDLPSPKDAATALWSLRQTPAEERLSRISHGFHGEDDEENNIEEMLREVAAKHSYSQKDVNTLRDSIRKHEKSVKIKMVTNMLDWWSKPEEFGELYLDAMQSYYQNFFAEEEKRIAPVLERSLAQAQEIGKKMSVIELVENLSQGVHFTEPLNYPELVLVPSFWSTPFIMLNTEPKTRLVMIFGGRPADMSLIPGTEVPDNILRVLKALADPTRLQIMHYLSQENLTPAQLAQRLRLRAPTVIHHLDTLRMAGLVHIGIVDGGRCYTARLDAIDSNFNSLREYLGNKSL